MNPTPENRSPDRFLEVTELSNDEVSREQVDRICQRYFWAGHYCEGRRVLELACGTGQGLGYLRERASSLAAGDVSPAMIERARNHYGDRMDLGVYGVEEVPLPDHSVDVILVFEAIYYFEDFERFLKEARRLLVSGGKLLIATANKDLPDFNPSPYSVKYYGVKELTESLTGSGFQCRFFGNTPVAAVSARQRLLRPVKQAVVKLNLMPKTMAGKKFLKRLVFGGLVPMPAEITGEMAQEEAPIPIDAGAPNRDFKVLYVEATADGL